MDSGTHAIKSVRIPSNAEMISESCFDKCESLCEIVFEPGSKLKEIGKSAFCNCAVTWKSIRIPSSVEIVGESCFDCCKSLCEVVN
jgi:hypothetical protein